MPSVRRGARCRSGMASWLRAGFLLFLFGPATEAAAQSFYGGLRGAVRDADGVVPGVELTLTNEETRVSRTTLSNAAGDYTFPAVVPGTYSLHAVRGGYKTFQHAGPPGRPPEGPTPPNPPPGRPPPGHVTVTGRPPLLETATASTGEVLDKKTLDTLPNHGRNPYLIASTMPTVIAFGDPHFDRQQDQNNTSFVALGGAQMRTNNFLIDGVPTTNLV